MAFGLSAKTVSNWKAACEGLLQDESGQDLIEYALVACLIALGAIASLKPIGDKLSSAFNGISSNVNNAI